MVKPDMFREIRLVSIGQDEEKVKSRVKGVWLPLSKPEREEILNLSGLTVHAVARTYQKGRLSLKLALAIAQTQNINPYYLAGASDEMEGCTEETIKQILTEYGHAELVDGLGSKKPKKANIKAVLNAADANAPSEPAVIEETASDEIPSDTAASDDIVSERPVKTDRSDTPYDVLLSSIQEKVSSITEYEQKKLDSMPWEAAEQFLKGLLLRTEYSEDAKYLASLIKMLLVM